MTGKPVKFLVYDLATDRMDWVATRANVLAYYKSQWKSGEWKASEATMAAASIDDVMKKMKRKYYAMRREVADQYTAEQFAEMPDEIQEQLDGAGPIEPET